MAAERYTFDTNILFYAIDGGNAEKHALSRRIIGMADSRRVTILLQTLGELSNAIIKRRPALLPRAERMIHLVSTTFEVMPMEFEDVSEALLIYDKQKFQFWDAALWATARRVGCATLFSEDMQDGRTLGGVTIRNPFKMSKAALEDFLA